MLLYVYKSKELFLMTLMMMDYLTELHQNRTLVCMLSSPTHCGEALHCPRWHVIPSSLDNLKPSLQI